VELTGDTSDGTMLATAGELKLPTPRPSLGGEFDAYFTHRGHPDRASWTPVPASGRSEATLGFEAGL